MKVVCALCLTFIPRRSFRLLAGKKAVIIEQSTESERSAVKSALPDSYNSDSGRDPAAVCRMCLRRAYNHRANIVSAAAKTFYSQRRRECREGKQCSLCVVVKEKQNTVIKCRELSATRRQAERDAPPELRRQGGGGRKPQQQGVRTENIMMIASSLRLSNRSARSRCECRGPGQ